MRGKLLIPPDVHAAGRDFIEIVRAAREFCRRLFCFGAGLHVSGIARLRGSRACSADGQQNCRCAVRGVGGRGCVGCGARARGGAASRRTCAVRLRWSGRGLAADAASRWGCAVRLRPHGRLSFPFEQQRFAAPGKTLDASCAHQEGVQHTTKRSTRPSQN